MASGEVVETLHDHLKDQVSTSVKEALDKATSVLSNLHRVQSFLHLIQTLSPSHSNGVIKSALEQVKAVRNDSATLLQTVYLTEIGLQSLQDFGGGGSNSLSSLMPILGDTSGMTSSSVSINSSTGNGGGMIESLSSFMSPSVSVNDQGPPPIKKQKLGVSIATCSSCHRKFASSTSDNQSLSVCRSCRGDTPTKSMKPMGFQLGTPTNANIQFSSTPKGSKPSSKQSHASQTATTVAGSNKRTKLLPMNCKICSASFLYRRCLFRHLRENHTGIDLNNLMQYIEAVGIQLEGEMMEASDVSLESAMDDSMSPSTSHSVKVGSDSIITGPPVEIAFPSDKLDQPPKTSLSIVSDYQHDVSQDSIISSLHSGLLGNDTNLVQGASDDGVGGGANEGVKSEAGASRDGKDGGKYACDVCSKSFDRPYRLHRHVQIHNPNRPRVQCHVCDRSFTRIDTLENHVKCLHSEERPFKCDFKGCDKNFPIQSSLMHHLKTHMGGKPYKCQECEDSFALLGEYKSHMTQKHADTKDLRCPDCFKIFPSTEALEQHRSLEHRLECELCGKTFARLGYLEAHVEVHNGSSLYNCRVCALGFSTEYPYKQHIKTHPNYGKGKKIYPCQVCDKSFYDAAKMMLHYRSEEHREKSKSLGLAGGQMLHTIDAELAPDMSALVDKVAKSMEEGGTMEDNIIQSIVESEAFKAAAASVVGVEGEGGGEEMKELKKD